MADAHAPDDEVLAVEVAGEATSAPVAALVGELDAGGAGLVRATLSRLVEERPGTVTVDLGRLDFVDSVGLGVLIGAHRQAEASGVALVFTDPTPTCLRVLELTGLTSVLDVRS